MALNELGWYSGEDGDYCPEPRQMMFRRAWKNDSLLVDGLRAQKALHRRGRSRSDLDSQEMFEEASDVTGSVA